MRKFLSATLATVVVLSTLTACNSGTGSSAAPAPSGSSTPGSTSAPAPAPAGEKILVGGLAPLTGEVAVYGTSSSNGTKLAIEEINAAGGVLGKQLEFILLDEKGDPVEALNAYNKLESQGVVAVIGDITSKPSIAVAEAAATSGMPMITPTASHPDVTVAGDNVFRVCFTDPLQGRTMAVFAKENLKASKVAIMYNTSDDYSQGVAAAYKAEAEAQGMVVTNYEGYSNDDVDFKAQLTNIQKNSPDVVFVPDYYAKAALISAQARGVGLTVPLTGADGWDGVVKSVDAGNVAVVENSYFCSHYSVQDKSEVIQNFIKKYTEKYGEAPDSFAALGYDAAKVLAAAIEKAGSTDKAAVVKAINETNLEGVTGTITFDENGDPVKSLAIIKIVNGEYTFDSKVMAK